ncbi:MAG: hypothetical protein JRK53_07315 [Deltaproteobacteria bacterium]|nr:hypothetical protein [Deltaproteobacteria bacterium]
MADAEATIPRKGRGICERRKKTANGSRLEAQGKTPPFFNPDKSIALRRKWLKA